ncbi:uncharacterized protein LOC126090078 [Schistocerca cancellata]|uniref:uncharacterized protein LOC126090078 n=1 Tax=Schistocerca cancellata TaxID=274614 RepID=UPI002117DF99|nr:uncharacterized protein LOC126090078 [Schistocerca cancellata]
MSLPLLLALALWTAGVASKRPRLGCLLDVNNSSVTPNPQPLLLNRSGRKDVHGFVKPDSSGIISLNYNEKITLACPGSRFRRINGQQVRASCVSASTFKVKKQRYAFADLDCLSPPEQSAQVTGRKCGSKRQYQMIRLGYKVRSDFYTLIDVCFDNRCYKTVYVSFTMVAEIGGKQNGSFTSTWLDGRFFGNIDVQRQYNFNTQVNTFTTLLGSRANRYISKSNFLTRGHLAARSDFMLRIQQNATYFYVNAAPQWKSFNGANWNTMENDVRSYAQNTLVNLEIYTGTHGITTLPNANEVETELYLYAHGRRYIPVPNIFWKIVYNAFTKEAVVLLGVNNPYIRNLTSDYIVCKDMCRSIRWLSWDANNTRKGYSYCCRYADFKETVPDAPDIVVRSLLT